MLKIQNLYKTFNKNTVNENRLFRGLNLEINNGDFVTIIGSNGAGKSTLLNLITSTIVCDSGKIILDGKDISRVKEYKINRHIGRVFQDPTKGTSPSMTILDNLSMAYNKGKGFGLSKAIDKKNIEYFKGLLSQLDLGLEDKLYCTVNLLSGGQRQAVSLIMAVMNSPKLLLLDEHTASLDPKTSEKIIEISKTVVEKNNITTLMVTHNMKQAIDIGNRLIMMNRGEVIVDVSGQEKKNLTVDKLLSYFEKVSSNGVISDKMIFS